MESYNTSLLHEYAKEFLTPEAMRQAFTKLELSQYRPLQPVSLPTDIEGQHRVVDIVMSDMTNLPAWGDGGRLSFLRYYEQKVLEERFGFIMVEVNMRLLKYLNDLYGDTVANIALQQFTLQLLEWVDRLLKIDDAAEFTAFKPNGTGGDDYSIGIAFKNEIVKKHITEFLPMILDKLSYHL